MSEAGEEYIRDVEEILGPMCSQEEAERRIRRAQEDLARTCPSVFGPTAAVFVQATQGSDAFELRQLDPDDG